MRSDLLESGTTIAGKYVVERTLGRGGMGVVYVVAHATTGKRMAMKCLLPGLVHDGDLVARFTREAQVMGRLSHRHVVDVFDVGRDGDLLYIVMELLDGKPLSELVHDVSLTLEEALAILLRAMEGVAAANDQGVVHRDLKPDNIFVCLGASGRLDDPRVLDFGISKLDEASNQPLTRSGVAMGTPNYMALEQLNGQRDLDPRVDVYAMGVILYEAISGQLPYRADSMSALAIRMLTGEPEHLASIAPDLPPGLADVVMKAMAKQRDDRFRSVRQLIVALRPFVPRGAGIVVPEGTGRPLRTPRSTPGGRSDRTSPSEEAARTGERRKARGTASSAPLSALAHWAPKLALAAVFALAAVVAAFFLWRAPRAKRPSVDLPAALPARIPASATSKVNRAEGADLTLDASVRAVDLSQTAGDAGRAASSSAPTAGPSKSLVRLPPGGKKKLQVPASARISEPKMEPEVVPQTTTEQSPPPKKGAEGRAGRLGSEEF